jgi:hypothetical protein
MKSKHGVRPFNTTVTCKFAMRAFWAVYTAAGTMLAASASAHIVTPLGPASFSTSATYSYSYYPAGVTSCSGGMYTLCDFGPTINGSGNYSSHSPKVSVVFGGSGATTGEVVLGTKVSYPPQDLEMTGTAIGSSSLIQYVQDWTIATLSETAELSYQIRVNGPSGLIPVAESVELKLSPYSEYGGFTSVLFSITAPGIPSGALEQNDRGNGTVVNTVYNFVANETYNVSIDVSGYATAYAGNAYRDVEGFSVGVYPTFTIDQENARNYSLEFSPGIGSAVPEPSTWATMLLGFAGLCSAGIARRWRST